MPRALSTALVLALLGATTVAFVVTERLKLKPSPVTKVFVTKIFSPTCECGSNFAVIRFRLRKSGRLTLAIVDANRRLVRTLVGPVAQGKGTVVATWDGQSAAGRVVSDGAYRARVQLGYRRIYMPNRINVDTTPPVVTLRSVTPHVFEPGKAVKVRYAVNEPARVTVFLNGKRALRGRSTRLKWKLEWEPRVKPGRYSLTATARDRAGNLSNASRAVTVVAPLRLVTHRVQAAPGARFVVRLRSDGRPYRWALAQRSGSATAHRLRLRAPKRPGRYRLVVTQDGLEHVVRVVVSR